MHANRPKGQDGSLTNRQPVTLEARNSQSSAMTLSTPYPSSEDHVSNATPRRRVERAMALSNGKPLEQFPSERCCIAAGCTARLSRYNPKPTCAAHGGWGEAGPARRRSRAGAPTS